MRTAALFALGIVAGGMIAVQSVLNAALGKSVGDLGSVFVVTCVSIIVVVPFLFVFPSTADLRNVPGPTEWYLYLGGAIGIMIVGAPIVLVPRMGATATLTALVVGQLALGVVIDAIGLPGVPRIPLSASRLAGVAAVAVGALLIART